MNTQKQNLRQLTHTKRIVIQLLFDFIQNTLQNISVSVRLLGHIIVEKCKTDYLSNCSFNNLIDHI